MLMYQIVSILLKILDVYQFLIVAGAILSWVPSSAGSWVVDVKRAINTLTDPFLDIFRQLLGSVGMGNMMIDFSPIVALVALQFLERLIVGILL